MKVDYLEECRTLYSEKYEAKFGTPKGCSEIEVEQYERRHGLVFPTSYRQFLFWMGNDTDGVLNGSEWFLDDVEPNTQCLHEFLAENGILLKNKFRPICFFSHQGYMSAWFYLTSNFDDPACYFFSEANESNSIEEFDNFSSFLLKELKGIS